jgi:hypothetical protein
MKIRFVIIFILIAAKCIGQSGGIVTTSLSVAKQRNIIFEGNSLSNFSSNASALFGYYIPITCYNNSKTGYSLAFSCFAVSGETQTTINSLITTNITPRAKYGDIIIIWEGTNDLRTNSLSGAQGYANLITYVNTVKGYGCKVIVCTITARDLAGDDADLMTRIGDYNTLVRNNSSLFDAICDLGADSHFDARSDCSNTTYYNADKLHMTTAGQDVVIGLLSPVITTVLALP